MLGRQGTCYLYSVYSIHAKQTQLQYEYVWGSNILGWIGNFIHILLLILNPPSIKWVTLSSSSVPKWMLGSCFWRNRIGIRANEHFWSIYLCFCRLGPRGSALCIYRADGSDNTGIVGTFNDDLIRDNGGTPTFVRNNYPTVSYNASTFNYFELVLYTPLFGHITTGK